MRHNDILITLQRLTDKKPKQRELAEALDVAINVISNRAVRNTKYSLDELIKISSYFNVDLVNYSEYSEIVPAEINIEIKSKASSDELKGKSFNIPYWESGNKEIDDKLKDDELTEFGLDLQFIVKKLKCNPENLRLICMPGEDMDGGNYPLKNKDILLIDVSRTDTYESGIYFATSHGNSRVYVRRVFEKNSKEKSYYTSIDNTIYKSVIDKIWTEQQWKESDIKIIGRVIKNMSYLI